METRIYNCLVGRLLLSFTWCCVAGGLFSNSTRSMWSTRAPQRTSTWSRGWHRHLLLSQGCSLAPSPCRAWTRAALSLEEERARGRAPRGTERRLFS